MSYEQKRIVVRVMLPGPPEKVTDWEAVASAVGAIAIDRKLKPMEFTTIMRDHTTERPSRLDTGVDVVLANITVAGDVIVGFADNDGKDYLELGAHDTQIAALGFPTEPMQVVETQAEGEVSP
jgi:hypothetical protein